MLLIIAISQLVLILLLAVVIYRACRRNQTLEIDARTSAWKLRCYRNATNVFFPVYSVRQIDFPGHIYCGKWAVFRNAMDGHPFTASIVKVFTDDDDDFNRREAEELCETLNLK